MPDRSALGDPGRRRLLAALAAGVFSLPAGRLSAQGGGLPAPLPPGRSIHELRGTVLVNGRAASRQTAVVGGDVIETGEASRVIFAVGKDAFLLRASGRLETRGEGVTVRVLRLVTGKLLSVFGSESRRVETPVASIGIRGTGLYVESDPALTYVCTCYGTADIAAIADPLSGETVVSEHHDAPRYVLSSGAAGTRIRLAPVFNHTDQELALIEALVGRTPPFEVNGGGRGNRYGG